MGLRYGPLVAGERGAAMTESREPIDPTDLQPGYYVSEDNRAITPDEATEQTAPLKDEGGRIGNEQ